MKEDAFAATTAAANSDRIELIQTFVRIVQAGSLSAAAAQMGTTQPTISRRLQQLERTLGVRLLQRSTHAMKLTEDGERCFERAKELLSGWEAFESDLRGAGVEASGSLRVVVPHAFGQVQLIGPLTEFLRRHPRISVDWLLHERATDYVSQGIDCAIQVGEVTDSSLVAIKLAEVPRIMVATPSVLEGMPGIEHPRDLAALPWLAISLFYRRQISLQHAGSGEKIDVAIQPRMITDNLHAICNAALEGMGACIVSAWMVRDHIKSGRLVELLPEWRASSLPVSVIYPYARHYPARLRLFIDLMKEVMPAAVGDETCPPK
ncbi:MAG: LysR family transcriptional regulator [Rhodocyclaceae bacterium]|nr:LysR family transcriptional regulator [Rhodocyclaceae bacterium]